MAPENLDPSIAFLLNSGKVFDVVLLAHRTEKALQIIMPWYQMTNAPSQVCKDIQTQALIYAKAIDYSVDAAHYGFTVCEDALTLVEHIQTATVEQKREFLEGVRDITKMGLAKAEQAKKRFIHVRSTVENLLNKMKTEDQEAKMEVGRGPYFIPTPFSLEVRKQLTKGIKDLEEFHVILTEFVAWWNELAMETNTQLSREEGMLRWKIDEYHLKAVDKKWQSHKSRYAMYVNEINIIQDRYPKLFAESKLFVSSDGQYLEPVGSPPPYAYGIPRSASPEPLDKDNNGEDPHRPDCSHKPEQTTRMGHDYGKHIPAFPHQPLVTPANNVIISEHLSATSYMSATLASVQVLEQNLCFIMLQFQCHPSEHRRFNSLRIKWRLKTVRGTNPAKMVDIAPKLAIGARNQEEHRRTFGFKVPAQFNMGGMTAGPEVNGEWEMKKKLGHAMHFTGSIRGHGSDAAEWTIEENHSAMTGIPPHFCVAAVVHYEGVLIMELDLLAKQRGMTSLWSSRNHAKEEFPVDVTEATKRLPVYKPSGEWNKWFPLFNGEIVGGAVKHEQETFARN